MIRASASVGGRRQARRAAGHCNNHRPQHAGIGLCNRPGDLFLVRETEALAKRLSTLHGAQKLGLRHAGGAVQAFGDFVRVDAFVAFRPAESFFRKDGPHRNTRCRIWHG